MATLSLSRAAVSLSSASLSRSKSISSLSNSACSLSRARHSVWSSSSRQAASLSFPAPRPKDDGVCSGNKVPNCLAVWLLLTAGGLSITAGSQSILLK
uniref:Uncharacterized protein n=1 Tax=Gasterosteus aculeatus TaxID=69293 RepID=G3NYJ6_GASAC